MNTCCSTASTTPASSESCQRADAPSAELTRKPRYAVARGDDAFVFTVDLPGVAKEGVTIDLEKDLISISATRSSNVPSDWEPRHRELTDLSYRLRLQLQTPVDTKALSARLDDGVLTLRLPLPEVAKPRRVEVN